MREFRGGVAGRGVPELAWHLGDGPSLGWPHPLMVITGGLWRGRAAQQQQSPIAGSFAGNLFLLLTVLVAGWGLDAPAGSVRVASACFRVARCREFCGKNPLRRLGDARGEGTHSVRLGLPRPDESGLSGCVCLHKRTKPEGHLRLKREAIDV